ncbi:hypothetical protein LOZ16_006843 [Ophidiomyces ophidiicola]|nr:hypothetical protein LOZ47_006798 [Ophidiomyces ophidiicola]KAI2197044.1 hypothetical protein LOZ16_006843 [Ophidiomyces ophidiicola]KAI2323705.1 hypothetical protein LOY98_006454 [Ophidiomyces ophidiicola]
MALQLENPQPAAQIVEVVAVERTAARKKGRAVVPHDLAVAFSPLCDDSVQGYPTDKCPKGNGVAEIKEVVDILHAEKIPSCLVAESALIYYGAGRIMHSLTLIAIQDWHICLPTEQLEQATDLFRERPECYIPFRRSALSYSERIDFAYPRFKLAGLSLFFILMPSEACHLDVTPANIEFSAMGLPYPTLPVFAQSLLDGNPGVDLEDLIDGMDLTLDWGEHHLDLGGTVDADWIWWRFSIAYDFNYEDERPPWYSSPDKRRDVWAKQTSPEAKKTRQSWKYRPNYATRFRKIGSKDPRSLYRNYC